MAVSDDRVREGTIDLVDGRVLGYREYGDVTGKPVVYLHGMPGSRLDPVALDEEYRRLGVRVVAIERPGYGLSTARRSWGLLDWPADVAAVADRLAIERFAVLGYSSGGKYAAACAYALPDRVTAAAIVSGVGPPSTPRFRQGLGATDRLSMTLATRARPLAVAYWRFARLLARRSPERFLGEFEKELSEPDKVAFADPNVRRIVLGTAREAMRHGVAGVVDDSAIQARAWGFDLGNIQPAVQVWHGDNDEIVPLHHATYVADTIPNAILTVLDGVGHLAVASRGGEIAAAIAKADGPPSASGSLESAH
jgi:pimeloyl-ACP methyl ester carboxylesterase